MMPECVCNKSGYENGRTYPSYGATTSTVENNVAPEQSMFDRIREKIKIKKRLYREVVVNRGVVQEDAPGSIATIFASSKWCLLIAYFVFYLMYLALGAFIFSAMETPIEQEIVREIDEAKKDFLMRNVNVTEKALETLLGLVLRANNRGVSLSPTNVAEPSWSFGQAMYFTSTVVTTIGYGNVTPLSKPGKMFCIFYAVFGILMTLLLVNGIVERLQAPTNSLLKAVKAIFGQYYGPFTIRIIHFLVLLIIITVILLILPALFFKKMEPDWEFMDALYFCYMSLTTIGLGSNIPGDSVEEPCHIFYKVATTLYLITGFIFFKLIENVFLQIPQLEVSNLFIRIRPEADDPEMTRLLESGRVRYTRRDEDYHILDT